MKLKAMVMAAVLMMAGSAWGQTQELKEKPEGCLDFKKHLPCALISPNGSPLASWPAVSTVGDAKSLEDVLDRDCGSLHDAKVCDARDSLLQILKEHGWLPDHGGWDNTFYPGPERFPDYSLIFPPASVQPSPAPPSSADVAASPAKIKGYCSKGIRPNIEGQGACGALVVFDSSKNRATIAFTNGYGWEGNVVKDLVFADDIVLPGSKEYKVQGPNAPRCQFYFSNHGGFTPGWESRLTLVECTMSTEVGSVQLSFDASEVVK
jgi:hypothetical protein